MTPTSPLPDAAVPDDAVAMRARYALELALVAAQREVQDADAMLQASAEAVGRHLGADRVGFFETRNGEVLCFGACWTGPRLAPLTGAWAAANIGAGYLEQVRAGRTIGVADVEADALTTGSRFGIVGTRAVIGAPIFRNGRWCAGLYVNQAETRVWRDDELALVRAAADRTWDAVERARAETALRRSEEQLRLAIEAADLGLWDVDVLTDTLFWPARVKAMFGISADVPVTMADFYAGLHDDDLAFVSAAFASAADPERRATYDVEYRALGKEDGVLRWVGAKGRAVFDKDGRCVRVLGTAIDITARKRVEARLRDLNGELERRVAERTVERDRVWRNSRDLLVVAGTDGVFRAVNPAWTEVLGHDPEEVVGRSAFDFLHPDDAASTRAALQTAGAVHDLTDFENRYRHKDGSFRWLSWRTAADGETIYGYGRDVTEAKAQDAALAGAEAALRQAQKMEAVGQLTGGIAHDFNNLLQGLIGSLDLIRRKPDRPERVAAWAEAGLEAAARGAKLTGQLLAFSRSQKLELKPLNVAALVLGLRELLERTLGAAIHVEIDVEPGPARVVGDATQLEMAVLNLAINARDAMPDGGALTVRTRSLLVAGDPELESGRYVELSVADTGAGMAPEVASRAFDPFFTTKAVGKGTGLGLSQVYGMARQGGGAARIERAEPHGVRVKLLLRRTEDGPDEPGPHVGGRAPQAAALRVLAVDDDADVRRFLSDSLDVLGYDATVAGDGAAGLAALEAQAPDLLMLDFAMPGQTGAEVARAARERGYAGPILFASGYAETAAIEAAAGVGATMLRKPFRVAELQAALTAALAANGAVGGAAA